MNHANRIHYKWFGGSTVIWCNIQGIATNTMTLSATLWMNVVCVLAVCIALFPSYCIKKRSINRFPSVVAFTIVCFSAIISCLPLAGPGFVGEDGTCWISMFCLYI